MRAGASGGRILGTLARRPAEDNRRRSVAALRIGVGVGVGVGVGQSLAGVLENVTN
ncbi:hypothetical protein AB0395_35610 [Streptosporangium sp. NPDC051023]|uniref:hypothetical protein n=1 Tax=Streptosporangium sp. NPDC051023 TaxID=3155410 RepID=UPI0034506297